MDTIRTTRMVWDKTGNRNRSDGVFCARCGRQINGSRFAVHVIGGGSDILHPADEANHDRDDPGDMGYFDVGPECAKRFGEFAQIIA